MDRSIGGMILTLTHPDYSARPLSRAVRALLKRLAEYDACARFQSEVAQWWRQRDQMSLSIEAGSPVIAGPGSERQSLVVFRRKRSQ